LRIVSMGGKAKRMTIDVLQSHFHLPMADVARKFEVCPTYFKRICRSHGIMRWPYRKLKSMRSREVGSLGAFTAAASAMLDLDTSDRAHSSSDEEKCADEGMDSDHGSSTTVSSSPDHSRNEGDSFMGTKRQQPDDEDKASDALLDDMESGALYALASLARGNGSGPMNKKPCWEENRSSRPAAQPRPTCDSSFVTSGQLPIPAFLQTTPVSIPNQFSRASGGMTVQLPPLSQLLSH